MNDWKRRDLKRAKYGRELETKSTFPMLPYPQGAAFSIKQIAYLHSYCLKEPRDIVARYPKVLSLGQVYLALAHYYLDKEAMDEALAAEVRAATRKSLDGPSMSLPSLRETLGDGPLVEAKAVVDKA